MQCIIKIKIWKLGDICIMNAEPKRAYKDEDCLEARYRSL